MIKNIAKNILPNFIKDYLRNFAVAKTYSKLPSMDVLRNVSIILPKTPTGKDYSRQLNIVASKMNLNLEEHTVFGLAHRQFALTGGVDALTHLDIMRKGIGDAGVEADLDSPLQEVLWSCKRVKWK